MFFPFFTCYSSAIVAHSRVLLGEKGYIREVLRDVI